MLVVFPGILLLNLLTLPAPVISFAYIGETCFEGSFCFIFKLNFLVNKFLAVLNTLLALESGSSGELPRDLSSLLDGLLFYIIFILNYI